MFRYTEKREYLVNPPSSILHVANLHESYSSTQKIYDLFMKYGEVDGVKYEIFDDLFQNTSKRKESG